MISDPGSSEPAGLASELAEASDIVRQGERTFRRRRLALGLLLSLAGLIALAEVGMRLSDARTVSAARTPLRSAEPWAPLAEADLLRPLPGPLRYGLSPDFQAPAGSPAIRIVEPGLRGRELAPRAGDERRLLVVGDGYAFGPACADDETLAARLAQGLAEAQGAASEAWAAWTLGAPGYTATQLAEALRQHGPTVEPDLLVLYVNTADLDTWGYRYDAASHALVRDFLPLPEGLRGLLWHSHLYAAIVRAHNDLVFADPAPQFDEAVPFAHVREDQRAAGLTALREVQALATEREWPLLIVLQPILGLDANTAAAEAHREFAQRAATLGATTLDLQGEFDFGRHLLGPAPDPVSDDLTCPLAPTAYAELAPLIVARLADAGLIP